MNAAKPKDSRKKSVAKTFSWRAVATIITTIVAYVMTGEMHLAVEIGLLDTTLKLFFYYVHERAWMRV